MSLDKVKLCYHQAELMVGIPYVYGGNHGIENFRTEWRHGCDCSSGASVVLAAGGILADPRARYALDTEEFEAWGKEGKATYHALYVFDGDLNGVETHHCALWFNPKFFKHEWWQAANAEVGVGFIDFEPTGFHVRHWPDK
jgi:hypothetical protein